MSSGFQPLNSNQLDKPASSYARETDRNLTNGFQSSGNNPLTT